MVSFGLALFQPRQGVPFWRSPITQTPFGGFSTGDTFQLANQRYLVDKVIHGVSANGDNILLTTSIVVAPTTMSLTETDEPASKWWEGARFVTASGNGGGWVVGNG